ncbi:MAG: septal ring lytic transglycosylase RlpA family protein [Gaiellales bacterium]
MAATMVVAAAATTGPASAATGDRAHAAAVMHSLDVLAGRRAQLDARRSQVLARLTSLRADLRTADLRLQLDQANLAASRSHLAEALVSQYKAGSDTAATLVLSAGSFTEMVDRIDALNRIGSEERLALTQIAADSDLVRSDIATVSRRQAAVAGELTKLDVARAQIDQEIAARRSVLAAITARIRNRLAAEQRRRHRLAQRDGGPTSPPPLPTTPTPPSPTNVFTGDVTWYGPGFAGKRTASGEIFDPNKLTAASPWLAFGTMLRVTNEANGESVVVRVNDRGPFGRGVLDLSAHAARLIGLGGWQRCRIAVL